MNKENTSVIYSAVICLGLIVLILWIFCNAAFGSTIPERQREISVILYSAGPDGWEAFREGVRQAENDFSVNINIVTLLEGADAAEQFEIMQREVENGAEALAVAVIDYEELYERVLQEPLPVPIVGVESGFGDMLPLISADNYAMGKRLGEEIKMEFSGEEELTVALADESFVRDSVERRKAGLLDALEGKAVFLTLDEAILRGGADAAVALQKETLLHLTEKEEPALHGTKCYGIGSSASVAAAMDQGRIEKLIFPNEFNMGYLAVKMLLGEMNGTTAKETEQIDFYSVSSDELYDTQYERLLFPIVE